MDILIIVLAWWAIGIAAAVYDWTSEFDFQVDNLFVILCGGLLGPIFWLGIILTKLGSLLTTNMRDKTIMKKRK